MVKIGEKKTTDLKNVDEISRDDHPLRSSYSLLSCFFFCSLDSTHSKH